MDKMLIHMKYKYVIRAYNLGCYNEETEQWEDFMREYKCRTSFGFRLLKIYSRIFYDYIDVQKIGENYE